MYSNWLGLAGFGLHVVLSGCASTGAATSQRDSDGDSTEQESATTLDDTASTDGSSSNDSGSVAPGADASIAGAATETESIATEDTAETSEPEPPPRRDYPNGDPGCGLEAAAFCDTFDEIAPADLPEGRSGD